MDTQVDQTNKKKYNLNKNIKYSTETDEYGTRRNLLKMLQDHTSGLCLLYTSDAADE